MRTLTVSVTQEDIDEGTPCVCSSCPIAIAAIRLLGDVMVSVDDFELRFCDRASLTTERYKTPADAKSFMWRFDDEYPVSPATFIFEETPTNV